MSYCVSGNPIVHVQGNMIHRTHITNSESRGKSAVRRWRRRARAKGTEPSFIRAIASELSKIEGGRIADHLTDARHLLENAFRAVEQTNDLAALCEPTPHAA